MKKKKGLKRHFLESLKTSDSQNNFKFVFHMNSETVN